MYPSPEYRRVESESSTDERDVRTFERLKSGALSEKERSKPSLKQLVEDAGKPTEVPLELIDKMSRAGTGLFNGLTRDEAAMLYRRIEEIDRSSPQWHTWMWDTADEHPCSYLQGGTEDVLIDPAEAENIIRMLRDPESTPI